MDPTTLIIKALDSGISPDVGVQSMVPDDIRDAYHNLTMLLAEKLAASPNAQEVLEAYAAEPDLWEGPLIDMIEDAGIDQDPEIIDAAQNFMEIMDVRHAKRGRYSVEIDDEDQEFV